MSFTIIEDCVGINSLRRTLGSFLLPRLCYGLNRNIWFTLILQNLWRAFESHSCHVTTFQVRFASREHTSQVKTDLWKLDWERSKHTNQTPNMRTFLWYLAINLSNYLGARRWSSFPSRLSNACHALRASHPTKIPFPFPLKRNACHTD